MARTIFRAAEIGEGRHKERWRLPRVATWELEESFLEDSEGWSHGARLASGRWVHRGTSLFQKHNTKEQGAREKWPHLFLPDRKVSERRKGCKWRYL